MRVIRGSTSASEVTEAARSELRPAPVEHDFRGRSRQLGQLRSGLLTLSRGTPVRQLVIGEQGIGKSRLMAEALSSTGSGGVAVHTGRARELESDRPFGPLIDALGLHAQADDVERRHIAQLIEHSTRRTGDAEQRHAVVNLIAGVIKRQAETGPIALVLEDIQWADRLTVATLTAVIAVCLDRPLGVFLTRRVLPLSSDVDVLFEQGRPAFERIDLEALDAEVVALLVYDYLGASPGPKMQQQIDGAGGNPAMLLALLHGWQEAGALHRDGESIETASFTPPMQMRPAVLARLARLSERCQDMLTVAAVFERPFGVAMLAAAAQRSVIDVLADLREALAARLLLEVAGVLSFRHQLVRQIIYEATPTTVRAELHRQIADALQVDRASRSLIGHHQLRAAELRGDGAAASWPEEPSERTSLRWGLLTKTESEVARLVSRGLSNKQAGVRLHVSARTVETHLAHVFAKLGLNSRVELAAAAGRAGYADSLHHHHGGADLPDIELAGEPQADRPGHNLPVE